MPATEAPATLPPGTPTVTPTIDPPPPAAPEATSLGEFDKHFGDLEDSPTPPPTPAPAPSPAAKGKPAAPAPKPAAKPEPLKDIKGKPVADKPEAPKDEQDPDGAPPAEPEETDFNAPEVGTIGQVRSWGKRMGAMAKKATVEARELKSRLEALEKSGSSPTTEALTAQLKTLEKRLADSQGALKLTQYERSEEYRDKYERPWVEAQSRMTNDLKQMYALEKVENPDGSGEIINKERQATPDDFEEIYNLPLGKAARRASELFGQEQASIVMSHWRDIHNHASQAYQAIQENRGKAQQFEQQSIAQREQMQAKLNDLWTKKNSELIDKYQKWFGEHEGDKEWNEDLMKGRELANRKFNGEIYFSLTPEQRVELDAQIAMRASAFTPLRRRVLRVESENAQLKKDLEEMRGSAPGKPPTIGEPQPEGDGGWEKEFEKNV